MTDYLTEQEQIDLLKNWIKRYSLVILAGVILAIILITGWRYWQQRQEKMLTRASSIYDEMLNGRAQNDRTKTEAQAQKLFNRYPKTTYAELAALMLARQAAINANYIEAKTHLKWVIKNSDIPALRQIAKIRLARIQIADNKPEASLKTLTKVDDLTFNGLTDEVRGDAYLALNEINKAREAYQRALNELPNAETIRPLLQMKYDNLAIFESSNH